uniref:RRM domain-containing protein n=1 Tax=Panagrolaimus sp. ES5 TaxID=591445 RepID=A0AC34GR26_9BILA
MHFNSDDGDEGEKPICQECGAAFLNLDNLSAHFERCSIRKKKLLNERSIYMAGFNGKIDVNAVKELLTQFGKVEKVIVDKEWDRYSIAQFENSEQAAAAIKKAEIQMGNDKITITQARMKTDEYNFQPPEIQVDDILSELQKAENTSILEQMELIINAFGICNETRSLRIKICRFLEKQFGNYFNADIRCRLFGSSISGLGTKYADADINFIVGPLPGICTAVHANNRRELGNVPLAILTKEKLTYEEYSGLSKEVRQDLVYRILYDIHTRLGGISHVRSIGRAKCAVVRFLYNGELQCELSIGNMFSEKKAQFLTDITNSENDVIHKVLFILRLWAQTHGIFGTNSSNKPGAFKSYAFSLLFVAFLQDSKLIGPITFRGNEFIDDWVTDYIHPHLRINPSNETLISVIRGFFVYICQKIKENSVVSIRDAKIYEWEDFWVNAATIDARITEKFEKSFINVQDPLELSHNVCASVGRLVIGLLRRKAMLSLSKLKTASSFNLSSIFDLSAIQNGSNGNDTTNQSLELQLILVPELSPSKVLEAVNTVFEDILKLDLIPEQTNKRHKLESKALHGYSCYFSTCETWIGRRPIKREIQKKHKDLAIKDVEQMVSATIQRNSLGWDGKSNDPLLEFCVETLYDPDTGILSLQFRRNMGDTKKVTDIFHFFQQFFEKDNCQILRNILSIPFNIAPAGPMMMEKDGVVSPSSTPSPNAMEMD